MFNNNIKALEKINKTLANRISRISLKEASKSISAIKNENGEYILAKNDKYIDDTPSPQQSAEELYAESIKTATTRHDFIVIFGLGLGNLLDYAHSKSICQLYLYEPDINILRFTMEYVDLTKYFADGRLFISDNIVECSNKIQEKYLINDRIEFLYLKNYVLQKPSEFTLLTERIFETCQEKIIDMNTIKKMSKVWYDNIFKNLKYDIKRYSVDLLKDKFYGKTALILGAGPSLKDNIELIKANRDKFIIFAVHRTLETLKNNGITPDFCVIIDSMWVKNHIVQDYEYIKNIYLIADIKADSDISNFPFKKVFNYFPKNNSFSEKLATKMFGDIELFEQGGTSTLCAYKCAKLCGCKNIILAGIDLAFKNDTAYCNDNIVTTKNQNTVIIQGVARKTTKIKSITGEYVLTRTDYAHFVKQFEIMFAKDKTSNIYNITNFGAFINGIKYDSLENLLNNLTFNSFDTEKTIREILENAKVSPEKLRQKGFEILEEEKNKIMPIINQVNEWFEMYSEHPSFFDYAINILTSITSSMLLQEYLQIELLTFTKLVLSKDETERKKFLIEVFTHIKTFYKNLDNLI